jgi:hypothetical protein
MRTFSSWILPLLILPITVIKPLAQLSDREIHDLGMSLDGVPGRRPSTLESPTQDPTGDQAVLYTTQAAPARGNTSRANEVYPAVEAD